MADMDSNGTTTKCKAAALVFLLCWALSVLATCGRLPVSFRAYVKQ